MWRKRMQDLSRALGKPHPPLLAPMLFGVAAAIESITPDAMAHDGTRLRKNVGELRRMLGTDTLYCSVPSRADAEVVRASRHTDVASAILAHPRLAASLDAARQWQPDPAEPIVVAALTGPATLVHQLRQEGLDGDDETLFDEVGSALAAVTRTFCEAGVHVLQWHESVAPEEGQVDFWKGALGTAGNVARFHRAVPLLVVDGPWASPWPAQAVPAPTPAQHAGTMAKPHGRAWSADPREWPSLPGEGATERIVTTTGEVPADVEIAALIDAVRRVKGQ